MKRNQNIITLSKEHHHGLLFCWKIRQGFKLKVSHLRVSEYVQYFWKDLLLHFEKEERLLFKILDPSHTREGRRQHQRIMNRIQSLNWPETQWHDFLILADMLEEHIRYEERVLFPYLEETLSPEQLEYIGRQLEETYSPKIDDGFKDQFWIKSKI